MATNEKRKKSKRIEEFAISEQYNLIGEITNNDLDNSVWKIEDVTIGHDPERVEDLTGKELRELYDFLSEIFGPKLKFPEGVRGLDGGQLTVMNHAEVPKEPVKDPIVEANRHFMPKVDADALAVMGPLPQ